jgi:hypothetical protein
MNYDDQISPGGDSSALEHLASHGVVLADGLTDAEISEIQARCEFVFPPDLRRFLQKALPLAPRFPNWRQLDDHVFERLAWPENGICFDIGNRVFWWDEWGSRPDSDDLAISVAREKIRVLPKLIPLFGHSYLPSHPEEEGNPVFSVHQADVIHRGATFAEYFVQWGVDKDLDEEPLSEFEDRYPVYSTDYKRIPFWTDLAKYNFEN